MSRGSWPARVLLVVAASLGGSCVSLDQAAPPVETLPAAARQGATGQLALGREIYVTKCAKCHQVEPVRNYSREKWVHDILPDMQEESNLSASDAAAVRAYVLSVLGAGTGV